MGVAGRPKGSITTPQFKNYVTEEQRKDFVKWVMVAFKKNPRVATWAGDQMFGKAIQPITGQDGGPILLEISGAVAKKNVTHSGTGKDS